MNLATVGRAGDVFKMMDSFEFNKIAGALLFTFLIVLGLNTLSDVLFHAEQPEKPGFAMEIADSSAGAAASEEAKEEVPLAQLLAAGDVGKGEKQFKKCAACHTVDAGGANKVGPNLHNIVGRALGATSGFSYSGALTDKGGEWTYEALNGFIAKPKGWLPGTKMAFAGVKKDTARADLLVYLKSISPDGPAIPTE